MGNEDSILESTWLKALWDLFFQWQRVGRDRDGQEKKKTTFAIDEHIYRLAFLQLTAWKCRVRIDFPVELCLNSIQAHGTAALRSIGVGCRQVSEHLL